MPNISSGTRGQRYNSFSKFGFLPGPLPRTWH